METAEKSNLLLTVTLVAILAVLLVAIFAHSRGHLRRAENFASHRLVLVERGPMFAYLR